MTKSRSGLYCQWKIGLAREWEQAGKESQREIPSSFFHVPCTVCYQIVWPRLKIDLPTAENLDWKSVFPPQMIRLRKLSFISVPRPLSFSWFQMQSSQQCRSAVTASERGLVPIRFSFHGGHWTFRSLLVGDRVPVWIIDQNYRLWHFSFSWRNASLVCKVSPAELSFLKVIPSVTLWSQQGL